MEDKEKWKTGRKRILAHLHKGVHTHTHTPQSPSPPPHTHTQIQGGERRGGGGERDGQRETEGGRRRTRGFWSLAAWTCVLISNMYMQSSMQECTANVLQFV
jgi:hypothetical protein